MQIKATPALRILPVIIIISIFLCGCGGDKYTSERQTLSIYNSSSGNSFGQEADLLILVNPWNSLDKYYRPALARYTDEHWLDARAMPDFLEMIAACREAGGDPYIVSAYRNYYEQVELYEKKVRKLVSAGMDEALARSEGAKSVAIPGTSEHQLGLAVDLVDANYGYLDETQEDTPTQQWLMENSWRYGFILRYPVDKSEITGIIYEPWHYRYVGKDAAKDIYESGLCLEEWLEARAAEETAIQSRHPKSMANKWENYPAIA
ncbi:MAG: M15 family metallopeptidase [Oscillospiraceae bacterium]|nr:M15 family metallopeptidase [Oscillospiraceae bacterium]